MATIISNSGIALLRDRETIRLSDREVELDITVKDITALIDPVDLQPENQLQYRLSHRQQMSKSRRFGQLLQDDNTLTDDRGFHASVGEVLHEVFGEFLNEHSDRQARAKFWERGWKLDATNLKDLPSGEIHLPNNCKFVHQGSGHWEFIEGDESSQKVIYSPPRVLGFNQYVNASDILEGFIDFVSELGCSRKEFLNLPIELFICWLVIEADKQDENDIDENEVISLKQKAASIKRCKTCSKFLSKQKIRNQIYFCDGLCLDTYLINKIT